MTTEHAHWWMFAFGWLMGGCSTVLFGAYLQEVWGVKFDAKRSTLDHLFPKSGKSIPLKYPPDETINF